MESEMILRWMRFSLHHRPQAYFKQAFHTLNDHYTQEWRRCRNWARVKQHLDAVKSYRRLFEHEAEAELAAYHLDAIIVPVDGHKERSAALAFTNSQRAFPFLDAHRTAAYVLATRRDAIIEHEDATLLRGISLLPLSVPWEDFLYDIQALQHEYQEVLDRATIAAATARWMRSILTRPIYEHEALRAHEWRAVQNIERYLENGEKGRER